MRSLNKVKNLVRNYDWYKIQLQNLSTSSTQHSNKDIGVGLLFDIDGVILRGKKVIPAAKRAMKELTDCNGNFVVPTVFVTNAGNSLCKFKAQQLSEALDMEISQDQVMLSHSPLRMYEKYHNKCVLLSGQGPIKEIAKRIGFTNTITVNDIRSAFPYLDMVDHSSPPAEPSNYTADNFPHIDAIVLFGEPTRWETNLQLIVDVLMTNGTLKGGDLSGYDKQQVPVLACNMDLQWMSDFSMPRFGHGMFLHCLESVYHKLVGRQLLYKALIGKPSTITYEYAERLVAREADKIGCEVPIKTLYAIGDNPMADIYGANLYQRQLQQDKQNPQDKKSQKEVPGINLGSKSEVTKCHSVLVCTGVYAPDTQKSAYQKPPVFHGPRDMDFDLDLCKPKMIAEDVNVAVEMIFEREGITKTSSKLKV